VPTTRPDNPTDADLARAALADDRQAYGALVERHLPRVYAVALRIVGDPATAEDVAQDTFIRAYERLVLYDMQHAFRNWLLKIATNLALNHLRARRREREAHLRLVNADGDRAKETDEPGASPPDRARWQGWLDQLDESQRTAIVLFHFHEMPYAEIADVLDLPINTVRTLLHRGRKRLRTIMATDATTENGTWTVAI
jgi:RNA polymerase sigma-70 factor (ECF subfamily)